VWRCSPHGIPLVEFRQARMGTRAGRDAAHDRSASMVMPLHSSVRAMAGPCRTETPVRLHAAHAGAPSSPNDGRSAALSWTAPTLPPSPPMCPTRSGDYDRQTPQRSSPRRRHIASRCRRQHRDEEVATGGCRRHSRGGCNSRKIPTVAASRAQPGTSHRVVRISLAARGGTPRFSNTQPSTP